LCNEAIEHEFATVCVNSARIPLAASLLSGKKTVPITVVGFPLGASLTEAKVHEALNAIHQGAREIDMVIDLGALKSGRLADLEKDIRQVVRACDQIPVKVIIETALLTDEQKIQAALAACSAGAAFVKTSTGFAQPGPGVPNGATVADVALLRKTCPKSVQIKASGGIRTLADALAMIQAGATRLGTSAGVQLVQELKQGSSDPRSTRATDGATSY
jgi:deoxyribose-phosphate aldolase